MNVNEIGLYSQGIFSSLEIFKGFPAEPLLVHFEVATVQGHLPIKRSDQLVVDSKSGVLPPRGICFVLQIAAQ